MSSNPHARDFGLALGLALSIGGAFLLLDHLGVLGPAWLADGWPVGLALLGLVQVVFGDNRVARTTGAGLLLFGAVNVLAALGPVDWLDAGSYVWRVMVVSIGVLFVVLVFFHGPGPAYQAIGPGPGSAPEPTQAAGRLQVFSLWANQEHRVTSPAFDGARLSSIMGSYELDLRAADLPPGREAVLDVFSVMGEGRVRVPADWTVVNDVVPVLAEVRVRAKARGANPQKVLRVRGTALMSDLEVRN